MTQSGLHREIKTLVLYWSATGNTEKVANTIIATLTRTGIKPQVQKIAEVDEIDLYAYDLVFLGAPSYTFQPPDPVQRFIKSKMKFHAERGDIKWGAPRLPGKTAVVFCTYSGPHTGIREVTPVGDYIGQFFEHLGFEVAGKWYTVGEFHGMEELSTLGKLGDIRGRPNQQDLAEVESSVVALLDRLLARHK
jgi:flavodoxin